ncbi:MAG: hypothetical protein ACLFV6_02080 [Spirulinaceae cyanobacterium]
MKQTRFYQDAFADGKQEGRVEGQEEGRVEGRQQTKRNLVRPLASRGNSPEDIALLLDLPLATVEEILRSADETNS